MNGEIKCGIDPSIGVEDNCAWCCIHCEDKSCSYRCDIVLKVENKELETIEDRCPFV